MTTFLFILGIILFIMLIVVHELGHAIVARRNGVVVKEFGIFFPPRLWKKKLKNGITLTINALPLGGFVQMQGESDDSKKKGDYGAVSLWAKTKILLAGVAVNWVVAIILLTILAWTGLPQVLPNQFTIQSDTTVSQQKVVAAQVLENSPAAKAGLENGDIITAIAGEEITNAQSLVDVTKANAGEEVTITYVDNGETKQTTAQLRGSEADAQLGVAPGQQVLRQSTWSAPVVGVGVTAQFTWLTLKGVGTALANLVEGVIKQLSFSQEGRKQGSEALSQAGSQVAGPVGIVALLLSLAEQGLGGVVFLIAVISLSLALINTLPIPALDGGRLAVTLIFHGLKKRLTRELEEKINATGFMALIGLIILITIVDINRLGG